jgi:hypothetical protein
MSKKIPTFALLNEGKYIDNNHVDVYLYIDNII